MIIEQIYDKSLAHGSYAIESDGKIMLIDPGRNPAPYIEFAKIRNGQIVAVFETHPHADFVSSHLEFHKRYGAKIYTNPKVSPKFEFESMSHGDTVQIGKTTIKALFTPGHSPDHNAYLLIDSAGKQRAVFTGDSLFIGDVGRPDLREGTGNIHLNRKELAEMMYETIHQIYATLPDDLEVYPAHGAGSLCGKNMSDERSSTIGIQKEENWAFQVDDRELFVNTFLDGQSFIPKYFPYCVEINRNGIPPLQESTNKVPRLPEGAKLDPRTQIIDSRHKNKFKKGHLKGAINVQSGKEDKFETWLGSIIDPGEPFYLVAEDQQSLDRAIIRCAKIGYEKYIAGALVNPSENQVKTEKVPLEDFKMNPHHYTIIDVRNKPEVQTEKYFKTAINIPLPELKGRLDEIPTDRPIIVHCAGGYRSAIGSSMLERSKGQKATVYDLSDEIESFSTSQRKKLS